MSSFLCVIEVSYADVTNWKEDIIRSESLWTN